MQKHKVWVADPGAVLEKQKCSKQQAFSPEDDVLRVAIIFRPVQRMKVIATTNH